MIEHFNQSHTSTSTHTWTLELHDETSCRLSDLAGELADSIVRTRCVRCDHHYLAWRSAVATGSPPSLPSGPALEAFIRPILGVPGDPIPDDHVQGYVAQFLWYAIRTGNALNESIVKVDAPWFSPLDPGGDGLVIHRNDDNSLMFRLWEIKKITGFSTVASTVGTAYRQLLSGATEYLARFSLIGQEQADTDLEEFYGELVDLWIDGSPQAAAGVAVTLSSRAVPQRCFTTFGKRFPQFANPVRLKGLLTALSDFPAFADSVRDEVWKGL